MKEAASATSFFVSGQRTIQIQTQPTRFTATQPAPSRTGVPVRLASLQTLFFDLGDMTKTVSIALKPVAHSAGGIIEGVEFFR